jgi:hypothetical protein
MKKSLKIQIQERFNDAQTQKGCPGSYHSSTDDGQYPSKNEWKKVDMDTENWINGKGYFSILDNNGRIEPLTEDERKKFRKLTKRQTFGG